MLARAAGLCFPLWSAQSRPEMNQQLHATESDATMPSQSAIPPRPSYDPDTLIVLEALSRAGLDRPLNDDTLPATRRDVLQARDSFIRAHPDVSVEEREITRPDGSGLTLAIVTIPPAGSDGLMGAGSGGLTGNSEASGAPSSDVLSDDERAASNAESLVAGLRAGGGQVAAPPSDSSDEALLPLVLSFHGGGRVTGHRYDDVARLLPLFAPTGAVIVSPEYRLAPEHPSPAAQEDCYQALVWAAEQAAELGADAERLIVAGPSAGGGLALAVALHARDHEGPQALGYLIEYPMLDDRTGLADDNGQVCPPAAAQYPEDGRWPSRWNNWAWTKILGEKRGTAEVTPWDAPGRASDTSGAFAGLPPVFLSVASAETFRDEDVACASALWRDGVNCELHVFDGGTHAMEAVNRTWLARDLQAAQRSWLARRLTPSNPRENLALVVESGIYPGLIE